MHDTALASGKFFAETYGAANKVVVDIGGKNVNGSLRSFFESLGMKFICVDMDKHSSVDIVVKPGDKLPFETGSIDMVVSSSCFEHDPCFWITFKEMTRIVKLGGFIYISAPTNGPYHAYPGDNWRFYYDAGQALAYWSGYQTASEPIFPVKVAETFHLMPKKDVWIDFICVWERMDQVQKDITISKPFSQVVGKLERALLDSTFKTKKKWLIPNAV